MFLSLCKMLWMYRHTKYVHKYQTDIQSNFLDLQYVKILKYILRRPALPNIFKSTHFAYVVLYLHDRSVERRDSQGTNQLERAKPRCSVVVLSIRALPIDQKRRHSCSHTIPTLPVQPPNHPTTFQSPNITHCNPQPSLILKSDHARQINKSA